MVPLPVFAQDLRSDLPHVFLFFFCEPLAPPTHHGLYASYGVQIGTLSLPSFFEFSIPLILREVEAGSSLIVFPSSSLSRFSLPIFL